MGKGPYLGPELAPSVTSYRSGIEAFSSSGLAKLYFSCRLPALAHAIVVGTSVRGPAGVPDADPEQPTRLITLANAAARHVSAELGCAGDGLVKGYRRRRRAEPGSAPRPLRGAATNRPAPRRGRATGGDRGGNRTRVTRFAGESLNHSGTRSCRVVRRVRP